MYFDDYITIVNIHDASQLLIAAMIYVMSYQRYCAVGR